MSGITHDDLHALGDRLTDAFRHEIGLNRAETVRMEKGIYKRIDELKDRQDEQNGRVYRNSALIAAIQADALATKQVVERLEGQHGEIQRELGTIDERTRAIDARTKHVTTSATGLTRITLNRKEKTALGSLLALMAAAVFEVIRDHWPAFLSVLSRH